VSGFHFHIPTAANTDRLGVLAEVSQHSSVQRLRSACLDFSLYFRK
jgi:hypothetical protein